VQKRKKQIVTHCFNSLSGKKGYRDLPGLSENIFEKNLMMLEF